MSNELQGTLDKMKQCAPLLGNPGEDVSLKLIATLEAAIKQRDGAIKEMNKNLERGELKTFVETEVLNGMLEETLKGGN